MRRAKMLSFEFRILVLHPHLDDVNDESQILEVNEKVLKPLPQKFSNPWICEFLHADVEKGLDATVSPSPHGFPHFFLTIPRRLRSGESASDPAIPSFVKSSIPSAM